MVALSAEQAFLKAYEHYLAGRVEHAQDICRKVLVTDPGHAHAAFLLAMVEHRLGNHAQGGKLLQQAMEQRPLSVRLSYPPPSAPRYAESPHRGLEAVMARRTAQYCKLLQSFNRWLPWLKKIPAQCAPGTSPCWNNIWIPPLDGIAIYGMIAGKRPRRYIEVGSGYSTCFAARAIADHEIDTQIISIDPRPRAEIDVLCDEMVRKPLEECDLALFAALRAGDVVFIDNSITAS